MRDRGTISFHSLDGDPINETQLAQSLESFGVVSFSGATRQSLAMCLASWAVPFRHPHSTPAGVTVLSPRAASGLGEAGFGRGEVGPHTDRAHTDHPPALVAILIERAADSGGECWLVDAASDTSLVAKALGSPGGVMLRGTDGLCRPVIEQRSGRVRVRYRDDAVARPVADGPAGRELLTRIHTLIKARQVLRLGAGSGYLLHNHRVLHGRAAFVGSRRGVRFLATLPAMHPQERLNDGFTS